MCYLCFQEQCFDPKTISKQIDHIVYAVEALGPAMDAFEARLGVRPIFGGRHREFGTQNALVRLDKGRYLELLAVDPFNTTVAKPRWMGIDCLSKNRITRWALGSNTLARDGKQLQRFNPDMGEIRQGSRLTAEGKLLSWQLTMPLPWPEVELTPFLINWGEGTENPYQMLPNMQCSLLSLRGSHPNPETFTALFGLLGFELPIDKGDEIGLHLEIPCPNGLVRL